MHQLLPFGNQIFAVSALLVKKLKYDVEPSDTPENNLSSPVVEEGLKNTPPLSPLPFCI